MPKRNTDLIDQIRIFVKNNPGMHRMRIATTMMAAGCPYGKQHLSNFISEMVLHGELSEQIDGTTGQRLVYSGIAADQAQAQT